MNNNTILAIVFLMAGTLLITAVTTMVPAAYADNENEAEDESQIAQNDCDDNDEVLCIAANLGELDIE